MDTLEHDFQEAMAEQKLLGVSLAAANVDDTFNYFKTFGKVSLDPSAKPVTVDSTICLASATKIVTCVAAMQCVERGMIDLDVEVSKFVPELKDAVVLKGFDDKDGGKPIMEKAQNLITLRQLLSHTSGITGLENEEIMKYYGAIGDEKATLIPRYFMSDDPDVKKGALEGIRRIMGSLTVEPLSFEPGTDWGYGQSTDWAGQLVERLTHSTLESYCQENIFQPLSMHSTTYRLLEHPHVRENLMQIVSPSKDGTGLENFDSIYPLDPAVDMGGSNLYSSASDFILLLNSLLRNDGRLLKPETVDLMLDARLEDNKVFETEKAKEFFEGSMEEGMELDHCLAGLVNLKQMQTGRKIGGVAWSGATRCYWWIDRKAGVCGFYGSQVMGPGEKASSAMNKKFEKAVYDHLETLR